MMFQGVLYRQHCQQCLKHKKNDIKYISKFSCREKLLTKNVQIRSGTDIMLVEHSLNILISLILIFC